jgi:aspartyl-tRNA(Asn)/glutamyl-tRNA(Gln) amidotransferase subunit A
VCIMLKAVEGKYPKGSRTPDFRKLRESIPRRFRIGWPKEYFFDRVDSEVRQAIDVAAKTLESLGGRIDEVSLPHLSESVEPSTNIAMAEATRYHESQGYFPARAGEYGKDVRKRLEMGREVRAVDYLNALVVKREAEHEFQSAFARVDAIVAPTLPIAAPRIEQNEVMIGGRKETVRSALVRMNRPANLTGDPAISVPCGSTREGLPIGLQLIGAHWSEQRLLAIALAYEDATEWHKRHPALS